MVSRDLGCPLFESLGVHVGTSYWSMRVSLTFLEVLALNAQKFTESRDPGYALFSKTFRVMSGVSLGARMPNLRFVPFIRFGTIGIYRPKNLWGHLTVACPSFPKFFSRVMSGLSLGGCVPNLKFVALALTEILAFNAQNLRGYVTLATPPFTLF